MTLSIAGLVPLSTVDWPGKLCATVFLQGCPWACTYCHNRDLLDPLAPGRVDWNKVTDLLDRRAGLLDGVVFSGGEALRQRDLAAAIEDVRSRDYLVGLHTAGAYPKHFANVVSDVDWVGLDIKALPDDYEQIVGSAAGHKAWDCLDTLIEEADCRAEKNTNFGYEVRTTVHPGSPAVARFDTLLSRLRTTGVTSFALQEVREQGSSDDFRRGAESWDRQSWAETWESLVERTHAAGFATAIIRAA